MRGTWHSVSLKCSEFHIGQVVLNGGEPITLNSNALLGLNRDDHDLRIHILLQNAFEGHEGAGHAGGA